jgi:alpha-L-fucosidase
MNSTPNYLSKYKHLWSQDPKAANLAWWKDAKWGLFIHYGLYSQLGRGEWVMYRESIPLDEYEKLFHTFDPRNFNADFITDLALEAEMSYITLVSCHHEGFCLWDSKVEPYNSINSPAHRDLLGELADQCAKKGLGLFTYYTYMINWRHPYFLSRDFYPIARPAYEKPEPRYRFRKIEDFQIYVDYVHAHITELLTNYAPLAGMWLDIIMGYYAQPDITPVKITYPLIRKLQPHALISFKQGATGEEDFATPEQKFHSLEERARNEYGERAALIARKAWEKNRHKHNEVCATLQKGAWGYQADAEHLNSDELYALLGHAHSHNCNLLANVGPLPDGSIHPEDIASLRAVGRRIRTQGWPQTDLGGQTSDTGAAAG